MGDFRMTRAMAIVLLVAGSLVVVACGAATFLRYHKDDDDDDDDQNHERAQHGGDRATVVETSTTCITGSGNKTTVNTDSDGDCEDLTQSALNANPQQQNSGIPAKVVGGIIGNKTGMADKEYHNSGAVQCGGRTMVGGGGGSRTLGGRTTLPIGVPCEGMDVCGTPNCGVPTHSSPKSILRSSTPSNVYGAMSLQQQKGLHPSTGEQPTGLGWVPQPYHRNPDIIPAPLISPAGTVYSNYTGKGKRVSQKQGRSGFGGELVL